MTPRIVYQTDRATLWCGDCLAVLPTLAADSFDAILTDPPYGVRLKRGDSRTFRPIVGDEAPPDVRWIGAHSKAIVWGGNNFCDQLPRSTGWLVWDKWESPLSEHSMAELAWTNCVRTIRVHRQSFRGFTATVSHDSERVHPAQKTIALMEWCIGLSGTVADQAILDPFAGSGTTGVACIRTGRRFIGIEIDERYCQIAARRLAEAESAYALFDEAEQVKERQLELS